MKLAMTFLQIPLETRLSVLKLAICSLADPPACPSVSQERRTRLTRNPLAGGGIWQLPLRNPALPLLLVNKQINTEVKDVLEHTTANYHVDIMFIKSYGLWPTWTVPAFPRTQYIDSIYASFRIFEPTKDLDTRFRRSLDFYSGDGPPVVVCPPFAAWSFYKLLTGVLTDGLVFEEREPFFEGVGCTPRYAVKRIIVDVIAPIDDVIHQSVFWENESKYRDKKVSPLTSDRPNDASIPVEQRLAEYLISNLDNLVSFNHDTLDYGIIVYEGVVEDITLLVNGKECRRYDLNELFRERKINSWGSNPEFWEERQKAYAQWTSWVCERRKRMKEGLDLGSDRPVTSIMERDS